MVGVCCAEVQFLDPESYTKHLPIWALKILRKSIFVVCVMLFEFLHSRYCENSCCQEQYMLHLCLLRENRRPLPTSTSQLKRSQRLSHANTAIIHLPSCALVNCLSMEVNKTGEEGEEVHFWPTALFPGHAGLCVCPYFHHMNQLNDFCKIWYKHYAISGHTNLVRFNFLVSVMITWKMCELVMCQQH